MSFRKRNVGLTGPVPGLSPNPTINPQKPSLHAPGVRPSPLDGRPTTSTGTQTLDDLLTGHAGLAIGNSLLIEENGTTDFAGALLRFYAAEGVVQGHQVHVIGFGEQWTRDLPGLIGAIDGGRETKIEVGKEKMKIAWRYERLGEHGAGTAGSRAPPTPNRAPIPPSQSQTESTPPLAFCHTFDLTKRLALSPKTSTNYISLSPTSNPFTAIIPSLSHSLTTTSSSTIHRLILPTLLSPFLYPPHAGDPTHLLPFLHSLRALLRTHSTRLTAMITLPLSLHPRSTGLVRWIEILSDGVLELAPFPHSVDMGEPASTTSTKTGKREDNSPQGMLKIHKLPILTEKGGGGGGGDDLAFSLSRRRFVIKAFSLPPVEGDQDAQRGEAEGGKMKVDIDF